MMMNKIKIITAQKYLFLLLAAFSALLLVGLSYVMAGDEMLLLDVPGPVALQEETDVSRAKRVAINWSVLQNPQEKRIAINLFDGEIVTALHERTDLSSTGGGFVWVGHALGKDNSSVTLSVVDDVLVGSITLDGQTQYSISSNGQWQELQEIELSQRKYMEGPDILLPPPMPAQELNKADLCEDGSRVDLLVAYTAAARVQEGGTAGIKALINQRIADMNTANANSGLSFSYRLAHIMETNYAETGNLLTDINRLENPADGYLDDVPVARDQHLADLSALVVAQSSKDNTCGIASLMTVLSTNFAPYAYNVTALDYIGSPTCHPTTLAHEFGHGMGNHHDRANAGSSPIFPYSYGYQSPAETFRTIMAYSCAADYCPVVNFWSNPDVRYAGEPTGIDHAVDPNNSADNVRSMEQTAFYVANFRQDCGQPAPTATSTNTPRPPATSTATTTSTPPDSGTAVPTYTPDAPPAPSYTPEGPPDPLPTSSATRTPLKPWIFIPVISEQ